MDFPEVPIYEWPLGMKETTMLPHTTVLTILAMLLAVGSTAQTSHDHMHHGSTPGTAVTGPEGEPLGVVEFPTSCDPAAQPELERGLALMHHMNYERAETAFQAAAGLDPECALAYWGTAMTWVHPLWPDTVSPEKRAAGEALLARAVGAAHTSAREGAYVAAALAYYEGAERGERERLASFLDGWAKVHAGYPDDAEAALFHALALLGNAPAEDKTYAKQIEAGKILEGVMARIGHHPGAHHYLIHAYDFPPLAERALAIARRYDDLAPENTHALHMTSHIFTRLGLWPESIVFNDRAARAASDRTPAGEVSLHQLHALDYLAYAYLQQADDVAADRVAAAMRALEPPFQDHSVAAYALAAIPARLALERRDWLAAAAITPRSPAGISWEKFPYTEAISQFARALGAARSGQPEAARAAIAELARLEQAARALNQPYDWGTQVAIQRIAAEAWLEHAAGNAERALELAREAAELEASTEKSPVTPGEVLPARELYADMLVAVGRHAEAIATYEAALARSPNRFNSLSGAARAAELSGDRQLAASYYRKLSDICPQPTGRQSELEHARRFLGAGP